MASDKLFAKITSKIFPARAEFLKRFEHLSWPLFVLLLFFGWFMISMAMVDNQLFWLNVRLDKAESAIRELERAEPGTPSHHFDESAAANDDGGSPPRYPVRNPRAVKMQRGKGGSDFDGLAKQVEKAEKKLDDHLEAFSEKKDEPVEDSKGKDQPKEEGPEFGADMKAFIDLNPDGPHSFSSPEELKETGNGQKENPLDTSASDDTDEFELNAEVVKEMEKAQRRFRRDEVEHNSDADQKIIAGYHAMTDPTPVEGDKTKAVLVILFPIALLLLLVSFGILCRRCMKSANSAQQSYSLNCRRSDDTHVWMITEPLGAIPEGI